MQDEYFLSAFVIIYVLDFTRFTIFCCIYTFKKDDNYDDNDNEFCCANFMSFCCKVQLCFGRSCNPVEMQYRFTAAIM